MTKQQMIILLCLAFCLPQSALGGSDPLLVEAVGRLDPAARIDVTMLNGDRYLGNFAGAASDSLLINILLNEKIPNRVAALPMTDIIRLRENRSGAARGFKTGFTTGAVAGGGLSLLWGMALSSMFDGDIDEGTVFGFTLLGTLAGGLGVGVLGLGIGALADVWYTVYESPLAPPLASLSEPDETRLTLGFGAASGHREDHDFDAGGLYGQLGLQKPLSSHFELGPELAYYDLDGTISHQSPGYSYVERISPVITIGLTGTFQSKHDGLSAYLIAGTGYYLGNGEYLGLSFGGGLQYRTRGRQSIKIEIRDHLNLTNNSQDSSLDYFWTLGANFSFGL